MISTTEPEIGSAIEGKPRFLSYRREHTQGSLQQGRSHPFRRNFFSTTYGRREASSSRSGHGKRGRNTPRSRPRTTLGVSESEIGGGSRPECDEAGLERDELASRRNTSPNLPRICHQERLRRSATQARYCSGLRCSWHGRGESSTTSSVAYSSRAKLSLRLLASYSAVRSNHKPLRTLPSRSAPTLWTPGHSSARSTRFSLTLFARIYRSRAIWASVSSVTRVPTAVMRTDSQ